MMGRVKVKERVDRRKKGVYVEKKKSKVKRIHRKKMMLVLQRWMGKGNLNKMREKVFLQENADKRSFLNMCDLRAPSWVLV